MIPVDVTAYLLQHQNMRLRLEYRIVLQCAPFLKGLKVSSLISLEEDLCAGFPKLFRGTKVCWRILAFKKGKALVFLYRREELEEYVCRPGIRRILNEFGYGGMELEEMLDCLKGRIEALERAKKGFPHEIGVFLGYPAEDVESFIRTEGRRYLSVGYWKVYHDAFYAARTFRRFDAAKEYAVNELLSGKSLREITGEAE